MGSLTAMYVPGSMWYSRIGTLRRKMWVCLRDARNSKQSNRYPLTNDTQRLDR